MQFSRAVSLHQMTDQYGANEQTAHKLLRVARFHFYRQQLAATGPRQPDRSALFNALLGSEALKKAIADEAQSKHISLTEARAQALLLLEEIASRLPGIDLKGWRQAIKLALGQTFYRY